MTTHTLRLVLLVTLITIVAAQSCKFKVPFNSNLVGRRFFKLDGCYRPSVRSEVRVNPKSFLFKPTYVTRAILPICNDQYVFHYPRDGKDPFVVYFPEIKVPNRIYRSELAYEKIMKYCKRKHSGFREKYFPVGPTRKRFKESVRAIVKGALEIRDFGCTETNEGIIVEVEGRAFTNVDLDGIITYLLGVAYQYNFCAESA